MPCSLRESVNTVNYDVVLMRRIRVELSSVNLGLGRLFRQRVGFVGESKFLWGFVRKGEGRIGASSRSH